LEIALATVADAVVATDAQEKIIYLNPAAEAMSGWRAVDALGKPLKRVFSLGDQRTGLPIESPLQRIAAPDAAPVIAMPALFVDRSGRKVQVEYTAIAMRDEGRLIGAVVVCRPQRHVPEILALAGNAHPSADPGAPAEEQERATAALNSIGDAVAGTDFSGRVNYLSAVAEKITGWTQADACGLTADEVFELIDPATGTRIPCPMTRAIIENCRVTPGDACLLRRRDGSEVSLELSAAPMHDRSGGVVGAAMVAHLVTAARGQSDKPARLAHGAAELPNRSLFGVRVTQAIADARAKGRFAALLHVGLDRVKHIRDSLGRAAGDGLLEAVGRRLIRCIRTSDTVGRQGEDVFVVLLTDLPRVNDAAACAEKILAALQSPYRIADEVVRVSANVGIAIFPIDASEGEELLRCADFAMYQARYDGRNNYRLFSPRSPSDPSA
jgi:diguanylate cyclase (GGDEF)-like protein/PAS domain S-box-containing protein